MAFNRSPMLAPVSGIAATIAILPLVGLHQNTQCVDRYASRRILSLHSAPEPLRPMSQPFRRMGNQTAVLSKLRFQVPNPSAKVRHEISLLPLLCFRRPLQFGNARFNIFDLDGLGRVRHHAVGGSNSAGGGSISVHHDLQECRGRSTGRLL